MPRFIAIPVGQGDAFYLDRGDWSVLVDGGRSRSSFAALFQAVTGANSVNVAVCTHNDADHAMGILGLLEAGLGCGELWLPGRWLSVLPYVLKPFVEVFDELADNVAEAETAWVTGQRRQNLPPIETYAQGVREQGDEVRRGEDEELLGDDGWPESYVHILERVEPWEFASGLWPYFPYDFYRLLRPDGVALLCSAIEAAKQIRG